MIKDLKYLVAFINPVLALTGLYLGGIWAWSNVLFAFGLVPLVDALGPQSDSNPDEKEKYELLKRRFFDFLLYLNVPVVYLVLYYFMSQMLSVTWTPWEWAGQIFSVGIVLGTCGINVAHELGHRKSSAAKISAHLLLLPALYMHFTNEHNRGHHKNVGTPLDPASALANESVYRFWLRSISGCYINAWKLEIKKLRSKKQSFFHSNNQMIAFTVLQLAYLHLCYTLGSWQVLGAAVACGLVAILLLESINYIEHYGLRRKQKENGRYEKVEARHSWNANHLLGRIVLYELTRHADHHYRASKKYQILEHQDDSPQLPYGYPMSILLAMIPPLWYRKMNPLIPNKDSE